MTREERINLLNKLLEIEEKNDIGNLTRAERGEFQQWVEALEQESRKGHWIDKQHLFGSCSAECSSCHKRSNGYVHDNGFSLECKYYDFCPNCGCSMVESQESEEKE